MTSDLIWNIGCSKHLEYLNGLVSGIGEQKTYDVDSFKLGQCKSNYAWTVNGIKYHNNEYCAETTNERIQNQDDTDVDCGGPWVRKNYSSINRNDTK